MFRSKAKVYRFAWWVSLGKTEVSTESLWDIKPKRHEDC